MDIVTLLQGDCLELMKDIPTASVDMILCDLPYGTTRNTWDVKLPFDKLWAEYERIITDNGVIALFSQMPFTAELVMSNPKLFRYEWIWEKTQGTGFLNANRMPLKIHENILIYYKHLPTYNPQKREGFTPYTAAHTHQSSNYDTMSSCVTVNEDGSRMPIDIIKYSVVNSSSPPPRPILHKSLWNCLNTSSRPTLTRVTLYWITAWVAAQQV